MNARGRLLGRHAAWLGRALLLAGVVLAPTACRTVTTEDVCDALDSSCELENYTDCLKDGEEATAQAEERGCEDALDDYLECALDARCHYRSSCVGARLALESCAGPLPY